MELVQIQSFQVDHDFISKGVYLSRVDGDAYTYDVRMVVPNKGVYLPEGAMHTLEHLLATYLRSGEISDKVIYVGPMGCRTGFYLILRQAPSHVVIRLVEDAFRFAADFEGHIPGATRKECGNYRAHNLQGAKKWAREMADYLKTYENPTLSYPTK